MFDGLTSFFSSVSDFNIMVVLPFLKFFFTENIGFLFVCMAVLVVVIKMTFGLFKIKF